MRLEHLGPTLGGGCLIGSLASLTWRAVSSTPITPAASIVACCVGMILGYLIAKRARI